MAKILGIDVSRYQDDNSTPAMPDMQKAYNNGAKYMIARLSYGMISTTEIRVDEDGSANHRNADAVITALLLNMPIEQVDFGVGGYHYLSWSSPSLKQMAVFCDQVDDHPDRMPAWVDCECSVNAPSKAKATTDILDALYFVEDYTHYYAGVYTRASWWNDHVNPDPNFSHFRLWVAHYGVLKPAIPKPWTDWDIWQYSSIGDGKAFGMESKSLDLNWCQHPERVGLYCLAPVPTLDQRVADLERRVKILEER